MLLHMAEEGWHRQGKPTFLGMISALRALSAWRQESFDRAVVHAQQALAVLPNDEQDHGSQMLRGSCLCIVGVAYIYEGQFAEARSSLLEAYECSQVGGDRHFTRGMLLLVGVCSYCLGELHQAHEHYQQALSDARKQQDREITANALLSLASISYEWNDFATAEQQANEALALALEEDANLRNNVALQFALLAYARGQITSAQQQVAALLAQLRVTATQEAAQRLPDVLILSARLALEADGFQAVQRVLETLDLEEHMPARIFQVRLFLAQGKPQEAILQLERLLSVVQEQRGKRNALEIQVLLALAHAAYKQDQEARQWLQQALSQAQSEGFVRLFLNEGEPLARLLRSLIPAIHKKALRSYAQTILHAFTPTAGGEHASTASPSHRWAREAEDGLVFEPLSMQEKRVLELLAAGRTNPEIAQELVVSVNTVKDHVKHLYRKLGVSNRLQASEAARSLKLF